MEPIENTEAIIKKKLHARADATLHDRVLARVRQAYEDDDQTAPNACGPAVRRRIMKKRIAQLAAAAVVIVALGLGLVATRESTPIASAAVVFQHAADAMNQLTSFHV